MASITVTGAGYVGLVSAACFAHLGHNVRCVETNPERLARIRKGNLPLVEAGLDQIVRRATSNGTLNFQASIEDSLDGCEFAFIAVPTPTMPTGESDLEAVLSVSRILGQHANADTIVVIKSTVPVGTGDRVAARLNNGSAVVSNPEFLREGSAVKDFLQPDRVVIGSDSPGPGESVASLYEGVGAPVFVTDRKSAELAKYASNSYLAVRLSFINEIARISQATGANIDNVVEIMSADHRIGGHYLKTGIGWGGSCLPKDVAALQFSGESAGVEPFMLKAARSANTAQIDFLLSTVDRGLEGLRDKMIAVMGTAFKSGTDDVRESPALVAAQRLAGAGANVRVHDPLALENTARVAHGLQIEEQIEMLTTGVDAVILATDWPEYLSLDWEQVAQSMRGNFVFDARNALDAEAVKGAGLRYASYGRLPRWSAQ